MIGKERDSKYNWMTASLLFHNIYLSLVWIQFFSTLFPVITRVVYATVVSGRLIFSKGLVAMLIFALYAILSIASVVINYIFAKNLGDFNEIAYKLLWVLYFFTLIGRTYDIYDKIATSNAIDYTSIIIICWHTFVVKYYYDRKDLFFTNRVFVEKLYSMNENKEEM